MNYAAKYAELIADRAAAIRVEAAKIPAEEIANSFLARWEIMKQDAKYTFESK